ncbi:MAG: acyltransferase [Puniceicoccaceae bacterium]
MTRNNHFKTVARRLLTLDDLLRFEFRRLYYNLRGARIAKSAAVSPLNPLGKLNYLQIGHRSFVGKANLHLHNRITIGNNVVINDSVTLFTASHEVNSTNFNTVTNPIIIDDFTWIATGAMILPGVTVGRGAVVGAGAVVSRSIAPYQVVAGNPAKVISKRSNDLNYNPVEFLAPYKAWNLH